jgi:hypothetical protein
MNDEYTTMNKVSSAFLVLGLLGPFTVGQAQERWDLDFRTGIALPTQEVVGEELGAGLGFQGTVAYRLQQHLWAYGGWDWHHFNPEESFAGDDLDFEETGYALGARFEHPFGGESGDGSAYRIWVGGTFSHVEIENQGGDILADSGHGPGWEAGAGVTFPLAGQLRLSPGIRYRAVSRDVEIQSTETKIDLRYVTLEFGVSWAF